MLWKHHKDRTRKLQGMWHAKRSAFHLDSFHLKEDAQELITVPLHKPVLSSLICDTHLQHQKIPHQTGTQQKNILIKRDQLDVTCFFISLFNAQHVSDVNTSLLRSLQLICWVMSWVVLLWYDACWCYVVVWLGWCSIRMQAEALLFNYQDDVQSNKHKKNIYFSMLPQ